jgi:DNA-binding response OmpR family regulator
VLAARPLPYGDRPPIIAAVPDAIPLPEPVHGRSGIGANKCGNAKPFHYPELLARIGAVLGRVARGRDRQVIRYGDLAVNTLSREVTVAGITLDLSAKEYQLLTTLALEPGRVFTKAELLETVWGFRAQGRTRTLDSHASRLRQKLRAHSDAAWIANEWGVGYRLCRPQ